MGRKAGWTGSKYDPFTELINQSIADGLTIGQVVIEIRKSTPLKKVAYHSIYQWLKKNHPDYEPSKKITAQIELKEGLKQRTQQQKKKDKNWEFIDKQAKDTAIGLGIALAELGKIQALHIDGKEITEKVKEKYYFMVGHVKTCEAAANIYHKLSGGNAFFDPRPDDQSLEESINEQTARQIGHLNAQLATNPISKIIDVEAEEVK